MWRGSLIWPFLILSSSFGFGGTAWGRLAGARDWLGVAGEPTGDTQPKVRKNNITALKSRLPQWAQGCAFCLKYIYLSPTKNISFNLQNKGNFGINGINQPFLIPSCIFVWENYLSCFDFGPATKRL
jgi:hypothetical protein